MGVSKINFAGETLVDLTGDTVNADNLLAGYTAHNSAGEAVKGTVIVPTKVSQLENDLGFASGEFASKEIYGDTAVSMGRKSGTTVGNNSFAFGFSAEASGTRAFSCGAFTTASGDNSSAFGRNTIASGADSHAEGASTIALRNQHAQGHFNNDTIATAIGYASGTGTGTAFVVGNGATGAKSNAARIDYNGKLWCKQAYASTGADYAEYFEWEDGNPENEDRRGYFVTMNGKKVRKASEGDWILGIISGNPCIIGNTDMEWQGQFMRDEFGSFIKEKRTETIKELSEDEDSIPIEIEKEIEVEFYKVNPDYDPDTPYTFRDDRPEWDAVGMMGVLPVREDGTCQVNGFCRCADGGIATASETGYRVIERVSDNIVNVIFK